MKYYKVKTTKIDYCVEEEDVCDEIANDPEIEEDSEEYYDVIHNEINWIKETLPQVLVLEIECDSEDLDDMVGDAISEETGWLIISSMKLLKSKRTKTFTFFFIYVIIISKRGKTYVFQCRNRIG